MTDRNQGKLGDPLPTGITEEVSTDDIRKNMSDVVNRVGYGKERVVITRRDRRMAALVPIELVKAYEEMKGELEGLKQNKKEEIQEKKSAENRRGN